MSRAKLHIWNNRQKDSLGVTITVYTTLKYLSGRLQIISPNPGYPESLNIKLTMEGEKVDVAWTEFDTNMRQAFKELREDNSFFDVTLACEDSHMQAHKVIISAASPFFRAVLSRHPHPSPLLYLTGIKTDSLRAVLDFMYQGEVSAPLIRWETLRRELNSELSR